MISDIKILENFKIHSKCIRMFKGAKILAYLSVTFVRFIYFKYLGRVCLLRRKLLQKKVKYTAFMHRT